MPSLQDQRSYADGRAKHIDEEEWKQLEDALLPSRLSRAAESTWLDGYQENEEQHSTSVAGEAIEVDLPVANPLGVEVDISNIHFDFEFSGSTGSTRDSPIEVTPSIERISLKPHEETTVRLCVTPHAPGTLRYAMTSATVYISLSLS